MSGEEITSSCLLCSKSLVWHGAPASDYCSSWCRLGHEWLGSLHAALCRGRAAIDEQIDLCNRDQADALRQGEDPQPYAEDNATQAQIARNLKDLVVLAYEGLRRLDGHTFYAFGSRAQTVESAQFSVATDEGGSCAAGEHERG